MTMIAQRARDGFFGDERRATPHRSLWAEAGRRIGSLVMGLLAGLERARQRRQLLSLGDRALQDFACSRADAVHEGDKPFWRA